MHALSAVALLWLAASEGIAPNPAATPAAKPAEGPNLLAALHDALYRERFLGDFEGALKVYAEVAARGAEPGRSEPERRAAAHAQFLYAAGLAWKGDAEGAKAALRDLLVRFPDPALAAEAKARLGTLEGRRPEEAGTEGRILRVLERLRAPVSVDARGKGFDEILDALRKATGVNIGVDDAALDRVDRKRPRDLVVSGSGEEALEWFLRPLDLAYRVDPQGVWVLSRRAERWTRLLREEFAAAPEWASSAKGAAVEAGALALKGPAELRLPLLAEGNAAVEFDLAFGPEGGVVECALAMDASGAGYRARIVRADAGGGPGAPLPVSLWRGATKVSEAGRLPETPAGPLRVRLERLHERVRLLVSDRPVLDYDDLLPLGGAGRGGIGVRVESGRVLLDNLEVYQLPVPLQRTFLALGDDLLNAGDADRAIQQYEGIVRSFPEEALAREAQYKIGLAWLQKKDPARAIAEFRKTILLYPKSEFAPKSACGIWAALLALEKFDEARAHAKEMRLAYPGEEVARQVGLPAAEPIAETYRRRAAALAGKGDPGAEAALTEAAEAAEYLGLAARAQAARILLGDRGRGRGDLDAAAGAYAAALKDDPGSPEAPWIRMREAEVALLRGRPEEARAAWRAVTAEFPTAKEAAAWASLWLLSDALESGRAKEAEEALGTVRKSGQTLPAGIADALSDPKAPFPDPKDGGGPYFKNDLEYFRGLRSARAGDRAEAEVAWKRCVDTSAGGDWPEPLARRRLAEAAAAPKPPAPAPEVPAPAPKPPDPAPAPGAPDAGKAVPLKLPDPDPGEGVAPGAKGE